MRALCNVCERAGATLFCAADEAALCQSCDQKVLQHYISFYASFYFFTKLEITKPVSGMLYVGYMLIASYAFFVATGTIGFYACLWFTRLVYSSVKID